MSLFLFGGEEVAVDAEQWPMGALLVSYLPHADQRDSFPATLNSSGHQRHAPFQR